MTDLIREHILEAARIEKTDYADKRTLDTLKALNEGHDCTRCGKCCTEQILGVLGSEAVAIARYLNMPSSSFKVMFIERQVGKWLIVRKIDDACPWLFPNDNGEFSCMVYPVRPQTCVRFPWLTAEIITGSKWPKLVANEGLCPRMGDTFKMMTEGSP